MNVKKFARLMVIVIAVLTNLNSAANATEHHYTHKVVAVATDAVQYSARDLKQMGVPDAVVQEIEKQLSEKIFGIPELPVEDYPNLSVYAEGTGDVRVNGDIPVTAPLVPIPILVLVRRADCAACEYRFMAPIWASSTETGFNPPNVEWYRVEETVDTLQWQYGGGFNTPGLYDIKLATLHPELGIWMTQEFPGYEIQAADFWVDNICQDGSGVRVTLAVASLRKIQNGTAVTVNFGATGTTSGTLYVDPSTPRQGTANFTISQATYDSFVNHDVVTTVTLPDRSRERTVFFYDDLYACDDPNGGKG